ncbi:ABC transporter ATP-binding protein [Corynebacterium frankenforstense]|uniref:ABC transporter ATP-binding protein n=1 Tax=Corynebacterium frankenforstense TaxID=1230998 RepID=UPI0009528E2D|nr:ABC transporter ATP-binding protein [Corynebacterium frankenforstense]
MIPRLLRLAGRARAQLTASAFFRVLSQAGTAGLIIFPAWVYSTRPDFGLGGFILGMVLFALLGAGCRWAEQVCGHSAAFRLLAGMRVSLYDALVARGAAPGGAAGGRVMAVATRDINLVEVFFAHTLAPTACAAVATVAALVWGAVDPAAGTGALVVLVACLALGWALPFIRRSGSESALRAEIAQRMSEDARGREEIASLGAGPARLRGLASVEDRLSRDVTATGLVNGLRRGLATIWPWLGAGLMWWATGSLTAVAVVLALGPVFDGVEGFARMLPIALSSARRYFAEIDRPVEIPEPADPRPLPDGPLGLRLESVSLGYGHGPVVDDLSLEVPAGGSLGVVGPSGGGKSTLVSALVRLLDPESGRVVLTGTDGEVDVRDVATRELRNAVGLVEQSPAILRGSVLDNLRMGQPELSEEDARRALVAAHAREISLDAQAQELSGGQQQRVGLARVLARSPRILILDEATSHQDALGQKELTDMLARLEDVTVIVVAHRRSALVHVDDVLEIAGRPKAAPHRPGH